MAFAIQVFKITSSGSPRQRHAGRGCRKSPELGLLVAIRVELKEKFIYDKSLYFKSSKRVNLTLKSELK